MREEEALGQLEKFVKSRDDFNPVARYRCLNKIIDEHPHLAGKALELYQTALLSDKNNYISLRVAYAYLARMAEKRPDMADNVYKLFETALNSDQNNYISMGIAYRTLAKVMKNQPAFAPKGVELFKTALASEQNDYLSISDAYQELAELMAVQPEFEGNGFELFKTALHADKNSYPSFYKAYQTIFRLIKKRPEFTDKGFMLVKEALRSDKNDAYSSEMLYEMLGAVATNHPKLTGKSLKLFETVLGSDKNDYRSLDQAYQIIVRMIIKRPEVAEKGFGLFKKALLAEQNDCRSLRTAYEQLGELVKYRSKFAPEMLALFQIALRSDKNRDVSLAVALETLLNLVEDRPSRTQEVLGVLEACKHLSEYRPSLEESEEYTEDIRNHNEHINRIGFLYSLNQLLLTIADTKPLLTERVLDVASRYSPSDMFLPTYKACMRRLPFEKTTAEYVHIAQDLRVAYNGRFANNEEFQYAVAQFDKDVLEKSNIFRMQQRVMNILVSLSAEEKGISKNDALAFRKPDAPEIIKNHMLLSRWWLTEASFNGASLFKEYFPSYIKTIQNHSKKNPRDALSIHDAVYWLPKPMNAASSARLAKFIRKHIIYQNAEHQNVHRPLYEMQIIAQNWKNLERKLEEKYGTPETNGLKYAEVLAICKGVKYENQRHDKFAGEAAKHGVSEVRYHEYEDIYLAGLKVPEPFESKVEFKTGKYKGRFLPRDDLRVGFFGDYTGCCQHFSGAGASCAVSTVKDPFSQLFVIEDEKGKIVAGSWVWENTEGKYREVCFDNIECLGGLKQQPFLNKIYEAVGNYLALRENCRRVTIGTGCQDADISDYAATEPIALPERYRCRKRGGYSDAAEQVLLAENKNAVPLDKSLESMRYIRDVCFLDRQSMDDISAQIFPSGDQVLQVPENMSGFVIEDYQKGVVGYVLYDKEKKEIYDMAVLPEYRTDKNASSAKLLFEMMKVVKNEGGRWHAELRDTTTLRYMKAMEKRGVVKLKQQGIEREMSDGSKVVSVAFEPVSENMRARAVEGTTQNLPKPNNKNEGR